MPPQPVHEIRTGVLLNGGIGTRTGPIGKSVAKAMFPLNGYPIIHWQLADKIQAGISHNIVVVPEDEVFAAPIRHYFEHNESLYEKWRSINKDHYADAVRDLIDSAGVSTVPQPAGRYGTGIGVKAAIWNEADDKEEFFEVSYGDDLFVSEGRRLSQIANLKQKFQKIGKSVVTIMPVEQEQAHKYGIPVLGERVEKNIYRILAIEEKPESPKSNYAQFGSFILQFGILDYIENLRTENREGEVVLATAVSNFAEDKELYGVVYEGRRFDTGTDGDYTATQIEFDRLGLKPSI